MINLLQRPIKDIEPEAVTCPEMELILCCARTWVDPKTTERIKTISKYDINWKYLIQMAYDQKVIPLLYQSLKNICPEAVPKDIIESLRQQFQANIANNLLLTAELLKILNILEENNIPASPLKGPVLAASAYSNLALRQFCDLDIWVREQDIFKAREILVENEFQPVAKRSFLCDKKHLARLRYQSEHSIVSNDGMVLLDLHQRIFARNYFSVKKDFEYYWQRLEPVSLSNKIIFTFQTDDLLLLLCMHGSKHFWSRLAWLCDIAELIRVHPEIDWLNLMEKSRDWKCERIFLLTMFLVENLLGAEIPALVAQRIRADPESQSLARQVQKRITDNINDEYLGRSWAQTIFCFKMMDDLQSKISYCAYLYEHWVGRSIQNLITPTVKDREFYPLPHHLYFLYNVIRPIRLTINLGLTSWQFLRNTISGFYSSVKELE